MQITVYGFVPQDRSGRVRWLLEEMDIPFHEKFLSWESKEHQSEDYLRLNPMGRVPTVLIGDEVLTESAAICLALCDLFPERGLAPTDGSPKRALFYQWVVFAVATMEPPFDLWWFAGPTDEDKEKAKVDFLATSAKVIRALECALQDQPYLLGERFSAADVMVGSMLVWGNGILLENSVILQEYFSRVSNRPACVRSRIFESQ